MGFEDQAEQSLPRPCREMNGRSKRTYELTSSIVPRVGEVAGIVRAELDLKAREWRLPGSRTKNASAHPLYYVVQSGLPLVGS